MEMASSAEFIIIRHRKENLKKCSLRGFETDERFRFYTYPQDTLLLDESHFTGAFLLDMEGPELTLDMVQKSATPSPLVLIDATWRYAQVMISNIPKLQKATRCTLPKELITAYPRKQADCSDPHRGLASIEALYIAALITQRKTTGLLNTYYWKDLFLEKNAEFLSRFTL